MMYDPCTSVMSVQVKIRQNVRYCSQYLTGQFFGDKISLEHVSHDLCFSLDNLRDIFSIESYV